MTTRRRLRWRISVALVAVVSVTVAMAAAMVLAMAHQVRLAALDGPLSGRIAEMRAVTRDAGHPKQGWNCDPRRFLQAFCAADGSLLMHSRSLPYGARLCGPDLPADGAVGDVVLADGRRLRVHTARLDGMPMPQEAVIRQRHAMPPGHGQVVVLVASDRGEADADWRRLAWQLAVLWAAATALASVVALRLPRALLRPLERLVTVIDALDPGRSARRLPPDLAPHEAAGVVDGVNRLLDRVHEVLAREQATNAREQATNAREQATNAREQATLAHIAHELRTPLSAIRSRLEFRLLAGPSPAERAVSEAVLADVLRLQSIIDNLLMLARLESSAEPLPSAPVDLDELVDAAIVGWHEALVERRIVIARQPAERAVVAASGFHLRLVVDNLVRNIAVHAAPDSTASIAVLPDADMLVLQAVNRRRSGGTGGGVGQGIGLQLVGRIVARLGGTCTAGDEGDLFTVRIRLPAADVRTG